MSIADKLAEKLPKKYRTEAELKELKRIEIKTIATDHFGMDPKTCTNSRTDATVAFILEAQEKEFGKGKGKGETKGKAEVKPKGRPKAAPEPEADEVEAEVAEVAVDGNVDALGHALDSMNEEVKAILDGVTNTLRDIRKSQFMVYGLVANLFIANDGVEAMEERVKELEEEWEKQEGNE